MHAKVFAAKAGLDDIRLAETWAPQCNHALWDAEEQLLFELADTLHVTSDIDDPLWRRLSDSFAVPVLLEMLLLCGFYRTIAYFNNGLGIESEPGTPPRPDHQGALRGSVSPVIGGKTRVLEGVLPAARVSNRNLIRAQGLTPAPTQHKRRGGGN